MRHLGCKSERAVSAAHMINRSYRYSDPKCGSFSKSPSTAAVATKNQDAQKPPPNVEKSDWDQARLLDFQQIQGLGEISRLLHRILSRVVGARELPTVEHVAQSFGRGVSASSETGSRSFGENSARRHASLSFIGRSSRQAFRQEREHVKQVPYFPPHQQIFPDPISS